MSLIRFEAEMDVASDAKLHEHPFVPAPFAVYGAEEAVEKARTFAGWTKARLWDVHGAYRSSENKMSRAGRGRAWLRVQVF
jgi:hypothetical protein